jgi:hypothetical protein
MLSDVQGVLMALDNASAEINATKNIRDEGFKGFIAALLRYSENRRVLQQAGVRISFLPLAQAGRELAQACLANEEVFYDALSSEGIQTQLVGMPIQ